MISRNDIERLKSYFITTRGDNIAQGEITPKTTDTYDLGRPAQRWDTIYASAVVADSLSGTPTGSHSGLAGLDQDDHTQYVHISTARTITAQHSFSPGTTTAPFTLGANAQGQVVTGLLADHVNKEVIAGLGLTGGGLLTTGSSITLTVSLGTGLGFNGDNIELAFSGTPTTIEPDDVAAGGSSSYAARVDHVHSIVAASASGLDVTSSSAEGSATSFSRSDHTHAISTSSNPSTTAAILATNSSGLLQLIGLGLNMSPSSSQPLRVQHTTAPLRLQYDDSNYWDFYINSGGDLTLYSPTGSFTVSAAGDFIFNLTGDDVLPNNNYDINLGSVNKKYLTLYAAELRVETLVAQDTIATIGGRVLVGPTTTFSQDLPASSTNLVEQYVSNPGFETAGGGGADVFANWTENAGDGSIVRSTTKYAGTYSAALTAGATRVTNVYQTLSVTAEDTLVFSFWARGSGANTSPPRFRVYDVTNTSEVIALTTIESYDNTSTDWFFNKYVVTVPVGCSSLRIFFYCPDTSADIAYFDDVLVMKGRLIYVEHANAFSVGDILYSEGSGSVEFFYVVDDDLGGSGIYFVQRNLDGTGYNSWYAGDAIFNTGNVGYGFIDLYSYDSILGSSQTGPTIVGWVRDTEWYSDLSSRWAIGNLDGLYGYATDTYGVGIGDYASDEYLTFDPTNGLRFYTSAGGLDIGVSGIRFKLAADWVANRKISWYDSNNDEVAYLLGRISSGYGVDIQLQADATQTSMSGVLNGSVTLWANAPATGTPAVYLLAQGTVSTASLVIYGGTSTSTNRILYTAGYNQFIGPIYLVDGNTKITEGSNNAIRLETNSGYIDIGAQSTSYGHIYTDRNAFLLNKHLYIPSSYGIYVGTSTGATANDLRVTADIAAGGGLYIGSAGSNPVSGYISVSNTINISQSAACKVNKSTAHSHAGGGWEVISFDVEWQDTYNWHSNSTNPTRITPTLGAGLYIFGGQVQFASNSTGFRGVALRQNGSTVFARSLHTANNGLVHDEAVTGMIYLNGSTDYVELQAYCNAGTTVSINRALYYSPEFWCARVV